MREISLQLSHLFFRCFAVASINGFSAFFELIATCFGQNLGEWRGWEEWRGREIVCMFGQLLQQMSSCHSAMQHEAGIKITLHTPNTKLHIAYTQYKIAHSSCWSSGKSSNKGTGGKMKEQMKLKPKTKPKLKLKTKPFAQLICNVCPPVCTLSVFCCCR